MYYAYDSLNRLTNLTDWASGTTTFGYDLANRVTSISRPNNTVRLINYDAAGEATNIIEKTTTGFPIAFYTLGWTNSGRVAWEFGAPLPHTNPPPSRSMAYDSDNCLTNFNGQSVGCDQDGNMTSGPLTNNTLVSYGYDARNRLLAAGGLSYGYDPAGNRTAITNGATVTRFVINPNAKLPQVLMRITGGTTNYYIYGLGLLYEVTETATSSSALAYHYDYRGSTVAVTDGSGNIKERFEYSAYGMLTYRSGSTDTPFLYNGRYGVQTDPNGLLYMRARSYNSYLCRFINPDPSGFAGGLNWYCYADGNPISLMDPFGLCAGGENFSSWLGNNASGAAKAGYRWAYDQVHDLGATVAGLGNEIVGSALGMAAQSLNSPGLNQLSGSFNGWAQDLYNSRGGFARSGSYDPNSPAIQAANLGMVFLNPDSAVAETTADVMQPVVKGLGNIGGGATTAEQALGQAQKWLGQSYEEIAPGVYRSADNTRQFRMTVSDLTDLNQGPHVHFEAIGPDGRTIIENSHVGVNNP